MHICITKVHGPTLLALQGEELSSCHYGMLFPVHPVTY